MKFSQMNVMEKESKIIANRRDGANMKFVGRLFNTIMNPANPKYTFVFHIPHYVFIRSGPFCDDVAEEVEGGFERSDLANILYTDFLEYMKRKNDLHDLYKRLRTRSLAPASVQHYNTDEAHKGVLFQEIRGYEGVAVRLDHKAALRGECILRDMMDIYPDHNFTLENILEIVYCDFVNDYRKGIIKNPIKKITQYLPE